MSSIQPLSLLLTVNEQNNGNDSLEDNPLFTPDLEYYTPPSTATLATAPDNISENTLGYQSKTLSARNKARRTILPSFLSSLFLSSEILMMIDSMTINDEMENNESEPTLLLANVPVHKLNKIENYRRLPNAYLATFDFIPKYPNLISYSSDSFLSSVYHRLLLDLSLRWNMNIFLLDYNLARLRQCADKCLRQLHEGKEKFSKNNTCRATAFSIEELPLALEFYLQIDMDMFYMKTCAFRQAQAIQQHIFCDNEPIIRYGLTSCKKQSCPYCSRITEEEKQFTAIKFHLKQIHRFINGYQAILNCPTTCDTSHMIYVLTCPCGEADYIGYSSMSFRDILAYHRAESNRVIREFLIGGITTNRILQGIKSDEIKYNDHLLLYQHSARCAVALQLFLDTHPEFWCFVPMKSMENLLSLSSSNHSPISPLERTTTQTETETETLSSASSSVYNKRLNMSAKYLVDGVPKPPSGYIFTERQINEQYEFFRHKKDQLQTAATTITTTTTTTTATLKNVDLFHANIVAVLPENCSTLLCQLVLSLFVTHAECKLNENNERLINENMHRPYPFRGSWCEQLIRPSS